MSLTLSLFRLSLVFFCLSVVFSLPMPILSTIPFMKPNLLEELRENAQDFMKHMGIRNEKLLRPNTDEDMDPMWNDGLSFGDLLMDDDEPDEQNDQQGDSSANDVQNGFESGGTPSGGKSTKRHKKPKKWTTFDIPYYISRDFNSEQRQFIEKAIEEFNDKIGVVNLRPYEDDDKNYVMIFNGQGCYSRLGQVGGQQPVSLQSDKCLKKGIIHHEFLHVLGFSHEQNRPDRNDYVKILYNNIPKKWYKDYVRFNPSETIYLGKYDYFSVLHYPPQAPKSKKIAIQILDPNVNMKNVGLQKRLTKMDIAKAKKLYSS